MKLPLRIVLYLLFIAGVTPFLVAGVSRYLDRQGKSVQVIDAGPPFDKSEWTHRNEEHWLVDEMCRDIAEMVDFATKGSGQPTVAVEPVKDQTRTYTVTVTRSGAPVKATITLADHVWSPTTLVPLAEKLVLEWKAVPDTTPADDTALLQRLLTPTPEIQETVQAEVSAALTAKPLNPALHEQAAACLAVFGTFNSVKGVFRDNRQVMCRLAAHLATARALRKTDAPGPAGQFAEVALLHLIGRTAQAADRIDAMMKQNPDATLAKWLRVVRLAATGDWRDVPVAAKVSDAEALMAFSARVYRFDYDRAKSWLLEGRPSPVFPSFVIRRLLAARISVGAGGRAFIDSALDYETEDARKVFAKARPGSELGEENFVQALNERPTRAVNPAKKRIEVLGWGTWARYFQANVLFCMDRTIAFYHGSLGLPEDTREYIDHIEQSYGGLESYPILLKRYSNIKNGVYQPALAKSAAVIRKHPESISDGSFVCICQQHHGALPPSLPRYQDWLSVPFPFGTTYGEQYRVYEMTEFTKLTAKELQPFWDYDPYSRYFIDRLLTANGGSDAKPEVIEQIYARTKDIAEEDYLSALRRGYYIENPEKYLDLTRRLAVTKPAEFFGMGNYLAEMGRDREAAAAFLKAVENFNDRVHVSNSVYWLVMYLYDHGQQQKAEQIADEAAEVYSARGLAVKGFLLERQGKFDDAEAQFEKIKERYKDAGDYLDDFYVRNADRASDYRLKADALIKKAFPNGMRRFEIPATGEKPNAGLIFKGLSMTMKRVGIKQDAILVALDEIAVGTPQQYDLVLAKTLDPNVVYTVFQDGQYQVLKGSTYTRRLNVTIETYKPVQAKK